MQPKIKTKKTIKVKTKQQREFSFPLYKENFLIIGIGILFLIIGYIFMSENSVDGFLPTVIAPIMLVIGYCVLIPYGILKKPKSEIAEIKQDSNLSENTGIASTNIKTN